MKVFLSWSGTRAERAANLFKEFLEDVLQRITPWISTTDIELGAIGFEEIRRSLEASNYGIVFVTVENMSKPWLMFELGALSKQVESSRVIPLLVDKQLNHSMLAGPMGQFQSTLSVDRTNLYRLFKQLNKDSGNPIEIHQLDRIFEFRWPSFWKSWEDLGETSEEPPKLDKDEMNLRILSVLTSLQNEVADLKSNKNVFGSKNRWVRGDTGSITQHFESGKIQTDIEFERVLESLPPEIPRDIIRQNWLRLRTNTGVSRSEFKFADYAIAIDRDGRIWIDKVKSSDS